MILPRLSSDFPDDRGDADDGFSARWLANSALDQDPSWIAGTVSQFAARRRVSAQSELFARGDPARFYYLLLSGELLLYLPAARSSAKRGKSAVRFVATDELLIASLDGQHMADCTATRDSIVLCIDRCRLERSAFLDSVLWRLICRVHAYEIEWLLQSTFPDDVTARHDRLEQPEIEFVAELPSRGRRNEGTAS